MGLLVYGEKNHRQQYFLNIQIPDCGVVFLIFGIVEKAQLVLYNNRNVCFWTTWITLDIVLRIQTVQVLLHLNLSRYQLLDFPYSINTS